MALVFYESGHYPVQSEHMQVKRNGSDGVRASICEIEYPGVEARYRGNEDYQAGNKVILTL